MKKLIVIALAVGLFASCGGNQNRANADGASSQTDVETSGWLYKLDELMEVADQLVGETVTVRGFVTHTCKHAGKRCFIVGESQKVSMRIEAKGNIGGFNRELTGSEIDVTGVLHERRLSQEYIDQVEKDLNQKKLTEDGSAESCEAELSNIESMKAWMKENGKDYYSIYYMDGEDYDVLD